MKASSPSYLIFFLKILKMNCSSSCFLFAAKSISASLWPRFLVALVLSNSFYFTSCFFFSNVSYRSLFSISSLTISTSLRTSLWFWMLISSMPSGDTLLFSFSSSLSSLTLSEISLSSPLLTFWVYFSSSGNKSSFFFFSTYSKIWPSCIFGRMLNRLWSWCFLSVICTTLLPLIE